MSDLDSLMQRGQIPEAIEARIVYLEDKAHETKIDFELGKTTSAALMTVGMALSANPLIAVLGGVGLLGYCWLVGEEFHKTQRFLPIPLLRKSPLELFVATAEFTDSRQGITRQLDQADDEIEAIARCLSPREADEYRLLTLCGDNLVRFLKQIPAESRGAAYRYAIRQASIRGELPAVTEVMDATHSGQSTTDSMETLPYRPGIRTQLGAVNVPAIAQPASPTGEDEARMEMTTQLEDTPNNPRATSHAPDITGLDVSSRMLTILKAAAADGFPIGSLVLQPFVWFWGRSQSGKTSAALLLAMARMAAGVKVAYFSTDTDYPHTLPWARVEDSPEGYAVALDEVAQTMSAAAKHGLKGQSWVFDELLMAAGEHGIDITPLLRSVLAKGAKTGAGVIGISQVDTSTAHGIKGLDAAWRIERVSVQAIHQEDEYGQRSPTGRYRVTKGDTTQDWQIPGWMLTELNEYGQPCPLSWLMKQFPELNTAPTQVGMKEAKATQQSQPDVRQRLEFLLRSTSAAAAPEASAQDLSLMNSLPHHLAAIVRLSQKKGWVTASHCKAGIAALKDKSVELIRRYFFSLEDLGVGTCRGEGDRLEFLAVDASSTPVD